LSDDFIACRLSNYLPDYFHFACRVSNYLPDYDYDCDLSTRRFNMSALSNFHFAWRVSDELSGLYDRYNVSYGFGFSRHSDVPDMPCITQLPDNYNPC